MSKKIINIKEQIEELKEYLNSNNCKTCEDTAIKLEQYMEELKILLDQNKTTDA
jgi:hypothetical protein